MPFLTHLSEFVAIITEPWLLLLLSFIIGVNLYFLKSKKQGVFFFLMILLTGILIKVLKAIFQRARPLESLILESGYSFPSGHATMAMVFFGLVGYLFVKKKHLYGIILSILLVGFTRAYLGAHWLTDVLGGYVLGGIILVLGILIYRKIK